MDEGTSAPSNGPEHQTERERLEQETIAGYVATLADREELNRDWAIVDGEGWPA